MPKRKTLKQGNGNHHVVAGVLASLYPPARLRTIYDLLSSLIQPSLSTTEDAASLLIQDGDPLDYVFIMHHGYGVISDTAPSIGVNRLEQRWTHEQVIERVIQIQFRQGNNNSNVLCFGFQQPRPRAILESAGLACVSENVAVGILNSQPWRTVHARVGDSIMLYVLSHADIFHPVEGRSLIQVAGCSVVLSAQPNEPNSKFPNRFGKKKLTEGSIGKEAADDDIKTKTCLKSVNGDCYRLMERNKQPSKSSKSSVSCCKSKKRYRPHSWQRRKKLKMADNQNSQKQSIGLKADEIQLSGWKTSDASIIARANSIDPVCDRLEKSHATPFLTDASAHYNARKQHFTLQRTKFDLGDSNNRHCISAIQRKTCKQTSHGVDYPATQQNSDSTRGMTTDLMGTSVLSKMISKTKKKKASKRSTSGSESVSTWNLRNGLGNGGKLINRTRMFYKSKFSHYAGLPKNHLLKRLRPTADGAGSLFKAIFGQQALSNPACRDQKCSLLPKKLKCVCCLLRKLISNAGRCQYGQLLERHCSLLSSRETQSKMAHVESMQLKDGHKVNKHNLKFSTHSDDEESRHSVSNNSYLCDKKGDAFCSHSQVVAYLWAVCRRVIPEELLGSKKNWRILRKNIFNFVSLRRYENFTLEHCMFKLKLLGCPWCLQANNSDACSPGRTFLKPKIMLEKWLHWLFSNMIVPLIQYNFYVTDSEKYKQNVLYYRKPVWARMTGNAVSELMKFNFKKLSVKSTASLLKNRTLGFSRGRLLPKKTGMRLISNLGSSSFLPAGGLQATSSGKQKVNISRNYRGMKLNTINRGFVFKPINLVLKDVHYCLKFEQDKHAEELGCSVFDYNDAYLKLMPFIVDFKRNTMDNPVYIVVCDVLQAFDTIKQDKLVDIVHEFIHEEEYSVRRYSCVSRRAKSIKCSNVKPVRVIRERCALAMQMDTSLVDIFLRLAAKQVNSVMIDQAHVNILRDSYVKKVIEEHITKNILQIGRQYYLQVVGIPQGSVLSSLLCSLYYAHLEKHRLSSVLHVDNTSNFRKQVCCKRRPSNHVSIDRVQGNDVHSRHPLGFVSTQANNDCPNMACKGPKNVLLRLVDDWLFISHSKENALDFVIKMHKGFVDYNCIANKLKTVVNFDGDIGGSPLQMNVYRTEDGACFMRWSGILINCNTLEVQADYARYCGVNIRSTLTVWRVNNQGCYLMTKLCQFMRPKCHPIFYDTNINSPATVFLNAYQAFLLCAMKFHAYNCCLPLNGKCNSELGFRAIRKTSRYMYSLLMHRTSKIAALCKFKPLVLVNANEIGWLAFNAFHSVLIRKQSRYKELLRYIEVECQLSRYDHLRAAPFILSALDERRSSMFKYIIY